jgi:hypothetical protein
MRGRMAATRRTIFEPFGVVFRAYTKSPRVLDATDATVHFSQRQILKLTGDVGPSTDLIASGRAMARSGLRMMPTFPLPSLKFRTAGFPQYGFKAGWSDKAFPIRLERPERRGRNHIGEIEADRLSDPERA